MLNKFQLEAIDNFDAELRMCIDYMLLIWIQKPLKEMFSFDHAPTIEGQCEYFELDVTQYKRILKNNGILDKDGAPTEYGIKTGIVSRTPFGNPEMN